MGPRRRKIRTAARSRSPRAWVLGPGLKRGSKIIAAHTGREGSGRAASACYDGAPPRAVRDLDLESIRWLWPDDMTDHPHRRDGCLAAGCPACTATPDGVDNSMWLSYPNSCFWRPSPTYRALIGTRANVGWKRRSPLPPPPPGPQKPYPRGVEGVLSGPCGASMWPARNHLLNAAMRLDRPCALRTFHRSRPGCQAADRRRGGTAIGRAQALVFAWPPSHCIGRYVAREGVVIQVQTHKITADACCFWAMKP